jgi:hypothetical protein
MNSSPNSVYLLYIFFEGRQEVYPGLTHLAESFVGVGPKGVAPELAFFLFAPQYNS